MADPKRSLSLVRWMVVYIYAAPLIIGGIGLFSLQNTAHPWAKNGGVVFSHLLVVALFTLPMAAWLRRLFFSMVTLKSFRTGSMIWALTAEACGLLGFFVFVGTGRLDYALYFYALQGIHGAWLWRTMGNAESDLQTVTASLAEKLPPT